MPGKLHRGTVLQAAVWSGFVVVLPPLLDLLACVGQTAEPVLVQTFIAEAAIETLHVAVFHRSSGLNRVPLQTLLVSPLVDSAADKLRSVVAADLTRQSALLLQFFQYSNHAHSSQRCIDLDRQTL